jgi:hypothetical protein
MFVENTPIPKLKLLYYESGREAAEEEDNISAIASSYHTVTSVHIEAKFESSAPLLKVVECCRDLVRFVKLSAKSESSVSLLKIVECCRDLVRFVFIDSGGGAELVRSDILAVASLPRLKCLDISLCGASVDASSALVRCKGLKELQINDLVDPTVISAIG